MAGRVRPVARHDCGVALYAPTTKVKSHRVVWTDPFSGQRSNRRYATRELADEAFEATVAYVKAARAKVGPVKVTRGGPPTVDDLFAAVEQRWKQKNVTARYIEKRRGIYLTWIQPLVGSMAVHEWGSTDQHCLAVLAAARVRGCSPSTVQNIGSLLRLMVTVAHKSGLLPRTMQPMDDVDYVAARGADDEAAAGWACHPDSVSPKGKTQKGRPVIPWRNLRHHAATWLHEVAGFEWVDVSRTLGHASVAFTQARYVRPSSDAEIRNRAALADL